MTEEIRDSGMKAGAATLLDSSQQATPAKRAITPARDVPPPMPPRKTRNARPSSRHRSDSRVSSSKDSNVGRQSRSKVPKGSDPRLPVAQNDRQTAPFDLSPAEHVNDPHLLALVEMELMGAEFRVIFLNKYPVLDAKAVHRLAGCKGADKTRKARSWRSAGRIIGLPIVGTTVYPAFQFQPNGQPYPLIREVNKAFPTDVSDWQRAGWLVSPNEWLDGETPISAIQRKDPEVLNWITYAYEAPVG